MLVKYDKSEESDAGGRNETTHAKGSNVDTLVKLNLT